MHAEQIQSGGPPFRVIVRVIFPCPLIEVNKMCETQMP